MNPLDATFAALSDPTRRAILARLAMSDASVGDLAAPFAISLPAISRHLDVLERAALISRHRDGKGRRVTLRAGAMADARDWIDQYRVFWTEALSRLDKHLSPSKGADDD